MKVTILRIESCQLFPSCIDIKKTWIPSHARCNCYHEKTREKKRRNPCFILAPSCPHCSQPAPGPRCLKNTEPRSMEIDGRDRGGQSKIYGPYSLSKVFSHFFFFFFSFMTFLAILFNFTLQRFLPNLAFFPMSFFFFFGSSFLFILFSNKNWKLLAWKGIIMMIYELQSKHFGTSK